MVLCCRQSHEPSNSPAARYTVRVRAHLYRAAQKASRRFLKFELTLTPLGSESASPPGELTEVVVPAVELTLALDLSESLDRSYAANSVDEVCIAFLRSHLNDIEYFVDVGANQGLYSCLALNESPTVKVVAVEPDPYSQDKFWRNIHLNNLDPERLSLVTVAIGDHDGYAELMLNSAGNRAGSSLLVDQRPFTGLEENETIRVETRPLVSLVEQEVKGPWMLKLDIEGLEYMTLRAFLQEARPELWPDHVIIEAFGRLIAETGGSPIQALVENGFDLVDHDEWNFCFSRSK